MDFSGGSRGRSQVPRIPRSIIYYWHNITLQGVDGITNEATGNSKSITSGTDQFHYRCFTTRKEEIVQ